MKCQLKLVYAKCANQITTLDWCWASLCMSAIKPFGAETLNMQSPYISISTYGVVPYEIVPRAVSDSNPK